MTPRFLELHEKIWNTMKDEVLKGYQQTKNKLVL
jgi:NitT/TauT family transport system ATP-binding protein